MTSLNEQEAAARGVDPARIIFTDVAAKPVHIRRSGLADVFLDTPLCNAHTTGTGQSHAVPNSPQALATRSQCMLALLVIGASNKLYAWGAQVPLVSDQGIADHN